MKVLRILLAKALENFPPRSDQLERQVKTENFSNAKVTGFIKFY